MKISQNEFQALLSEFWRLPEGANDQQMESAAFIAMAVEAHPDLRSVLQQSVQGNTEAPGFFMKAFFLKRGLSDDKEFDQWLAGMKATAQGNGPNPTKRWWQFWR